MTVLVAVLQILACFAPVGALAAIGAWVGVREVERRDRPRLPPAPSLPMARIVRIATKERP